MTISEASQRMSAIHWSPAMTFTIAVFIRNPLIFNHSFSVESAVRSAG
jgi:hypothetical protein